MKMNEKKLFYCCFIGWTSKIMGLGPFDYTLHEENCGVEWKNWHRSFEWYLKANRIEDDDDKFVNLLHLAGRKVQELYASLPVPPNLNQEKCGPRVDKYIPHMTEYEMAVAKLNEFFEPKKNSTYERHVFRTLKQEKGEKIGIFAMRLRAQADKCDFGDTIEYNIKDQIIEKCLSSKLRRDLLKLGDATLENVLKSAKIFEAIEEQSKTFDQSESHKYNPNEGVNKIEWNSTSKSTTKQQIECTRCGYTGHRSSDEKCPARGKLCNKCNGRDHFSRKCLSKKRARPFDNNRPQPRRNDQSKFAVKQETDEPTIKKANNDSDETVKAIEMYQSNIKDDYIFNINTESTAENEIKCKIGGIEVTATIDSGSKYNVMDVEAWEYLKKMSVQVLDQHKAANRTFTAYGGHLLTVIGIFEAFIETPHNKRLANFHVVKDYGKILIGYETGIPLGVLKMGENVNQIEQVHLNKIKDFVINIPIDSNVKPVAQPYRRIPVPIEAAVDQKIDDLLQNGIIEKVNNMKKSNC